MSGPFGQKDPVPFKYTNFQTLPNPHFHTLCLDGVYVHPLPCLTNGDVADILQIAQARILRLLRRKGIIEDDTVNADETLAETEPALAELVVASTLGRVPAGPTLRQKDPIHLRPGQELQHPKGLCATASSATSAGLANPSTRPAWHRHARAR